MTLAPYAHFLEVSREGAWNAEDIDLRPDAEAWPTLAPEVRRPLQQLLAGFRVAEDALSEALAAELPAEGDPEILACLEAQTAEEARHARFFDRVAEQVLRLEGADPAQRRRSAAAHAPSGIRDLFESRLERRARSMTPGDGAEGLFSLVHMVLEGVVLTVGQLALLEILDSEPVAGHLPGIRRGVELVNRDERWHVGFGARRLQDAGPPQETVERISREGEAAARAWGQAVPDELARRAGEIHQRRLRAAGLAPAA